MRLPEILGRLIPEGQEWHPHERLWLEAPDWRTPSGFLDCFLDRISFRHGGDEYGNCSFYLRIRRVGGIVFFCDPHFQRDIEIPDPGVNKWIDRRYYPDDTP